MRALLSCSRTVQASDVQSAMSGSPVTKSSIAHAPGHAPATGVVLEHAVCQLSASSALLTSLVDLDLNAIRLLSLNALLQLCAQPAGWQVAQPRLGLH